jgi:hypothetical protein
LVSAFDPLTDSSSPDLELFSNLASENSELLSSLVSVFKKKNNLSTPLQEDNDWNMDYV